MLCPLNIQHMWQSNRSQTQDSNGQRGVCALMRFRPRHIAKSVSGERLAVQFRLLKGVLRHRFIPYCPFSGRSNVLESIRIVYYIAEHSILHINISEERSGGICSLRGVAAPNSVHPSRDSSGSPLSLLRIRSMLTLRRPPGRKESRESFVEDYEAIVC